MRIAIIASLISFLAIAGCGKRQHWTETEMQSHLSQKQAWEDARVVAMNGTGRNVGFITDTSNSMGEYISSYAYVVYERNWDAVEPGFVVIVKSDNGRKAHRVLEVDGEYILTQGTTNNRPDKWTHKDNYYGTIISQHYYRNNA